MEPIARGQITLTDMSDIISQDTAPSNPTEGMLWMNTGVTPPVLMVYRGGKWVKQNDYKDDPDYKVVTEKITTNESGIKVLKDEIKLKVSQTEVTNTVTTEINKIQVGGTNLLLNSAFLSGANWTGSVSIDTNKKYLNYNSVKFTSATSAYANFISASPGEVYSISAKSFTTADVTSRLLIIFEEFDATSTTRISYQETEVSNVRDSWQNYAKTWTVTNSLTKRIRLRLYSRSSVGTTWISVPKLEKGNKTTDWSPSPEDTKEEMDSIKTEIVEINDQVSNIDINLGSITSSVSSLETTTSKIENQAAQDKQNIRCNNVGVKIDYSTFTTANPGELYLHGYDSNENPEDTDGAVYWKGVSYKITKGMINPNSTFNGEELYLCSNPTANGGVFIAYFVESESKWKYTWMTVNSGSGEINLKTSPAFCFGQLKMSEAEAIAHAYLYSTPVKLENAIGVSSLETRVKAAEVKITDSAIVSTVKNSQTNGKDTFVQTSTLEQTTESITAKFSEGGGYNLLLNGDARNGASYWVSNGGGISVVSTSKGNAFQTTMPSGITYAGGSEYTNWVKLKPSTDYIYSAYIYTNVAGAGSGVVPMHFHCSADRAANQTGATVIDYNQTTAATTWQRVYVHFKTIGSDVWFRPFIYGLAAQTINVKEIGLYEGKVPVAYSPNHSELYDGITTINKDGIKVNSSNANTYTQMSSTGFYLKKNDGTSLLTADANGLSLTGKITVTSGSSVPSSSLTGTVSDSLLSQDIKNQIQQGVNAKDKVDNLNIGGRNLARKSCLQLWNSATGSFNSTTNTWTLTATPGSTSWGRGLSVKDSTTEHSIQIPFGKSVVYSFEIKTSKNINWNMDVNNKLVGGSSSTNDNDASGNRKNSARAIEANKWTKCWQYVENTDLTKNPNKLDIRDASSGFGIVTTNETEDVVFEIRNFQVEFGNVATDWTPAPEDVNATIATAQSAANSAASAASAAQSSANAANNLHADLSNDNKLTANEKQSTKKEWDIIASEKTKIDAEASKFSVSTTAYTTAYNNLNTYLSPLLSNLGTTSDITGTTYRTNFKNYYDARQDVLNAITTKSKALADAAQSAANSVTSTVNAGKDKWGQAYDRVAQWAYGAVSGSTTINGGLIQTNTILADKIAVGDFTNYADLNSNTLSKWGWSSVNDSSATGNPWFKKNSISRDNQISKWYPCNGGESLRIKADIATSIYGQSSSGGTATAIARPVGIMIFSIDNNGTRGYHSGTRVTAGANNAENVGVTSWTLTLGPTIRQFAVYVQIDGYPTFTGELKVRNVQVSKMASGELIVDGSITTDKITASGISADKIKTGSLVSSNNKSTFNLNDGTFNIGATTDASYLRYTGSALELKGKLTITAGSDLSAANIGSTNLYVEKDSIDGYLNGTDGSIVSPDHQNKVSGFIEIDPKSKYTYQTWVMTTTGNTVWDAWCFYKDGAIINGEATKVLVGSRVVANTATTQSGNLAYTKRLISSIPSDAKYIRIGSRFLKEGKAKLEKGDVGTDWAPSPIDIDSEFSDLSSLTDKIQSMANDAKKILDSWSTTDSEGSVVIDGSHIKAGTVSAKAIDAKGLIVLDDNENVTFEVTGDGNVSIDGTLQSTYFGDDHGYKITRDGNVVFNQATVRGDILLPSAGMTNYGGQIGNENLLLNSNFIGQSGWSSAGTISANGYNGASALQLSRSGAASGTSRLQCTQGITADNRKKLTPGKKFTMSGWFYKDSSIAMTSSSSNDFGIRFYYPDGTFGDQVMTYNSIPVDTWTYLTKVITVPSAYTDTTKSANFMFSLSLNGEVRFSFMKLEEGDKATPWCLASSEQSGEHIRIWAGSSYTDRASAPFRVNQDGSLFATSGTFSGNVESKELHSGRIHIHNNELFIDNTTSKLDARTGSFTHAQPRGEDSNPLIKLSPSLSMFNNTFVLGASNAPKLRYDGSTIDFHTSFQTIGAARTNIHYDFTSGGAAGLNFVAVQGGAHHIIKTSNASTNAGQLIFDSQGAQGVGADYVFTRMNFDTDTTVDVRGNIKFSTELQGRGHNVVMRNTSTGFAFYAS